jgi:lysophospholipase L1-like esterase
MKFTRTIFLIAVFGGALPAAEQRHWVGTWGAAPSPQAAPEQMRTLKLAFNNQTLREIVHTTIGGDTVRVRLSNAFGTEAVEIGAAHIALRGTGSEIVAGSDRPLTFGGQAVAKIPANAVMLSDPVKLSVPAAGDLAISLYIPGSALGGGVHYAAQQTAWVSAGDTTAAPSLTRASMPEPATITSWVFLTGVDVLAPESVGSIVAIGDSITDGSRSTVDANHRWPDELAARLLAQKSRNKFSVIDMGIGANRILHDGGTANPRAGVNALARFDRDVLAEPGVKYAIVLEGINDIGHAGSSAPPSEAVTAEDIIAAMKQMIERAHEQGVRIIGATLTPFEGESQSSRGYYTAEKAKIRDAVNEWIRKGNAFDGFVDFDKAVRDPQNPTKFLPLYDSGDQLHPSDAGYKAMGDAIDLNLFKAFGPEKTHWVTTWLASPAPQIPDPAQMRTRHLEFGSQTVREIVHTSIGGDSARVKLSNAFGTQAVTIGAAHIALSASEANITADSDRTLTFSGRPSVSIPPGAMVLSDPVKLDVPSLGNLAVSIFLPETAIASTVHYAAQQNNYVGAGDVTGAASIPDPVQIPSWPYLAAVDVTAPESAGAIVAFGDSITDGARSTLDANQRWPNILANRIAAGKSAGRFAVVDAGIGGNRILHDAARNITFGPSALERFDRDVLTQAGIRYIVILEGINDINHPGGTAPLAETVSAEDMIAGLRQLIARAHEKGVKVVGCTITPASGTGEKETKRLAVNDWIRNGKAFDGVVDFEKAVRDPASPGKLTAEYDSGDHLHPSDAGYKAMGEAVDLSLFR